jgi:hypothetical protein
MTRQCERAGTPFCTYLHSCISQMYFNAVVPKKILLKFTYIYMVLKYTDNKSILHICFSPISYVSLCQIA